MKIAILGWGSLIWDPRELPIDGDWHTGGPALPIEFSRISKDGRLTLVIDELNGTAVTTRHAASTRTNLDEAIRDLREREGTNSDRIGYIDLLNHTEQAWAKTQHPAACDAIKTWAKTQGWDAVIWTALASNFEQKQGEPFSTDAALRYLQQLTGEPKQRALEYLRKAPPEVDTPVRRLAAIELAQP